MDRRTFISAAMAAVVSGRLSGREPGKTPPSENAPALLHRKLGRTGLSVPIVGMGVMNTRDPGLIEKSYVAGIRLFDTAKAYGNGENEIMVGNVFKKIGVRNRVIIQTKVLHPVGRGMGRNPEPLSEKQIRGKIIEEVNGSLKRLQTDYVDILYYHAVDDLARLRDPGATEALLQLKKQGKIRFLGISTHSPIIPHIVETGIYDVLMVQMNIAMADDADHLQAIEKAAASGMSIVAMKTQGGNRLAGSIMNHSAALKWVLRHDFVSAAIPGFKTVKELNQNVRSGTNLHYTKNERQFLNDRNIKNAMGFCRFCRQCRADCPRGTDVPALMRAHMYAFGYRNIHQVKDILSTISPGAGSENCSSCRSCTVTCRHSVDIHTNLEQLGWFFQRNKIR